MANIKRSASTSVNAPPEVVFDILADPRQHARIDGSGTVRAVVTSDERLELGSEFRMEMRNRAPYKMSNRVVEFEEDRLIAWRHLGLHVWRYQLTPGPAGLTEVTETWDLSGYPGPLRVVFDRVLGRGTQRAIEATLVKLKLAAEADAGTAPGA